MNPSFTKVHEYKNAANIVLYRFDYALNDPAIFHVKHIQLICLQKRSYAGSGYPHQLTPYFLAKHQMFRCIWAGYAGQFNITTPMPQMFSLRCILNGKNINDAKDHAPMLFDSKYKRMTELTNMASAKEALLQAQLLSGDVIAYVTTAMGGKMSSLQFVLCRAAIVKSWTEMDPADYE